MKDLLIPWIRSSLVKKKKGLLWCIGLTILGLRFFCVSYGYDGLPLIASSDEAHINDVAWSYVHQGTFGTSAFKGLKELEGHYGYHPPAYILSQALWFKLFGLSIETLRGSSLFFYWLNVLILLLFGMLFRRVGVLERKTWYLFCAVMVLVPFNLSYIRQGRPEWFGMFWGSLGLFASFSWHLERQKLTRLTVAALFLGVAMSTHWALWHYEIFFLGLLVYYYRRGWLKTLPVLSIAALPFFVVVIFWLSVHRTYSFEAVRNLICVIKLGQQGSLDLFEPLRLLMTGQTKQFIFKAGDLYAVLLLSCGVIFSRAILDISKKFYYGQAYVLNEKVLIAAACCALNISYLNLTGNSGYNRYLPLSAVQIGALFYFCPKQQRVRRAFFMLVVFFVLSGMISQIAFALKFHHERHDRAPDRFLEKVFPLLSERPRVLADSALWFTLRRLEYPFRMYALGEIIDQKNWLSADCLDGYDLVIVQKNSPIAQYFTPDIWEVRTLSFKFQEFLLVLRKSFFVTP